MKRNIDELLKEKYNEIEYSSDIEFKSKNINHKNNNNLFKVASIVLLVVLCGVTVKVYNPGTKLTADNMDIGENIISDGGQKLEEIIPHHQIIIDSKDVMPYASHATSGIKVKYVLAIKVNKILDYTNYSQKQDKYSMPVTKLEVEVLKSFKGKINGNIEIYTLGGIVSLANWEKTLTNEQKEKQGYNKMSQEYKENTYVEIVNTITMDKDKPEVGKVYLVCLNEDNKMYDGLTTAGIYAMKEYDISTDSILENGKWTKIEDIKILNDVIKYE